MDRKVILVNNNNNEIGTESLIKAHQQGALHRSFGVFIINSSNQMLIQKRHPKKLHSGGLWCNTCSSHPKPGESIMGAAHRRLKEEMGLSCPLEEAFTIQYQVSFDKLHICENEFGHVLVGFCDDVPRPDPEEIEAYRWVPLDVLSKNVIDTPDKYAYWFLKTYDSVFLFIKTLQKEQAAKQQNKFLPSLTGI